MHMKFFAVIGLAASVALGAPTSSTKPTSIVESDEISIEHTVSVEAAMPAPTSPEDLSVGAGVGYGSTTISVDAMSVETEIVPTPVATAAPCTSLTSVAAAPSATVRPTLNGTESGLIGQNSTVGGNSTIADNSTAVEQPVAPVVPVYICTNNGSNCLTTLGSEFANTKLSFDNIAEFSLGPDGLLVRLNDLACVDAVAMDNATWYDLEFSANCTLPNYLQGAVEFEGNNINAPNGSVANASMTDVVAADRAEILTASIVPTTTAEPVPTFEVVPELHNIWFYNANTSSLCANVNDGLNDITVVCMYSDEGYAMLGTEEQLKVVAKKNREVTMPFVPDVNTTLAEELTNMLMAMTYDGSVFWADAWDTNIEPVMKYKMMGVMEEDINMGKDQISGVVYPLWQVINDCRSTCDVYAWCHSFTFRIDERVCRLSSSFPTVKPDEVDPKNPSEVTFVQNKKYKREDYVLPEDVKDALPIERRRRLAAAIRVRKAQRSL